MSWSFIIAVVLLVTYVGRTSAEYSTFKMCSADAKIMNNTFIKDCDSLEKSFEVAGPIGCCSACVQYDTCSTWVFTKTESASSQHGVCKLCRSDGYRIYQSGAVSGIKLPNAPAPAPTPQPTPMPGSPNIIILLTDDQVHNVCA